MTPLSILAITDFSASTTAVLDRAMQLAVAHRARLTLLYAPTDGHAPVRDAACRLSQHAFQLGQRHQAGIDIASSTADDFEAVVKAARTADLVVTAAAAAHSMKTLFCGLPEERLLRAGRRPVLVVRQAPAQAPAPYSRVLVAVDFSDTSPPLVATALGLSESALVELFHATSTLNEGKLRAAAVSEKVIAAYRQECTRQARGRMLRLSDSTDARRNRVESKIGHGDPARQVVVQQQFSGAQLIVVGKHPASAVSDVLFGSVAQRVLNHASSDVLVVPHDFQAALRAAAVRHPEPAALARRRVRAGAHTGSPG